MPHETHEQSNTASVARLRNRPAGSASFSGFAPPTSNTTYTPNQFFDVCLPHYSRGVVRLVGFLIRKTLGWCDRDGNPQEEQIQVSYQELVQRAGISRDMVRSSIDEAIAGGFIECVRAGRPSRLGEPSISALFQLRWDAGQEYVKDPARFRGFFEGEGNRTDIPNQFFDLVIPREPLTVIKVVGSVIRFSIGFQAQHGRRRQQAALSYTDMHRYARIRDSHSLSQALSRAIKANYIVCLEKGVFDRNAGLLSKAAVYCLRWADGWLEPATSQKNPVVTTADRSEKTSGRSQKPTAAHQSENPSEIQTKQTKETSKQQQGSADAANARHLLVEGGFNERTAVQLARAHSLQEIRDQIAWLPERAPSRSRLGMLRRAIEENWPRPEKLRNSEVLSESPGARFAANYYAGMAGNRGAPLAKPSRSEIQAGDDFLARLLAEQPEPAKAPDWGRAFSQLVREHERDSRVPSVVLALRMYGDRFFVRIQNQHAEVVARGEAARRDAHRTKFEPAWFAFLSTQEERFQSNGKDEYAGFTEHRTKARNEILHSRWALNAKERLARFDSEQGRLSDFQKFFGLPDFWSWDTQQDTERFQP